MTESFFNFKLGCHILACLVGNAVAGRPDLNGATGCILKGREPHRAQRVSLGQAFNLIGELMGDAVIRECAITKRHVNVSLE